MPKSSGMQIDSYLPTLPEKHGRHPSPASSGYLDAIPLKHKSTTPQPSAPRKDEKSDNRVSNRCHRVVQCWDSCFEFLTQSKSCCVLFTVILCVIIFGIGILVGYQVFKKKHITIVGPSPVQTTTTEINGSTISTLIPPITLSTKTPSTVTNNPSQLTSISTPTPVVAPCPPVLPQSKESKILLTLDETADVTTYKRYLLPYVSPVGVTTAMLKFQFQTAQDTWFLDDVSIKKDGTNVNVIDNGGFETGTLNTTWKSCDARFSWMSGTIDTNNQRSGRYCYSSFFNDNGSDEYLTQIFSITGTTPYSVEFYLRCGSSSTPILAQVTIDSA